MIVSNKLEPRNIYDKPKDNVLEQFDKAIEALDELIEENLTQEEKDRRNWKYAGVQFVLSDVEGEKENV